MSQLTLLDYFLLYISYSTLAFIYTWKSNWAASLWHLFVGLEQCKAIAHHRCWIRLSLHLNSSPSGLFHTERISSKAVLQRNCRQVQVVLSHWQIFCCGTEMGPCTEHKVISDSLCLVFTSITDMHLKTVNRNGLLRNDYMIRDHRIHYNSS